MIGRKSPFGKIEYKQSFLFQVKQQLKAGELYKITTISPSGESKDSILEGRFLFYKGLEKKGEILFHLRSTEHDFAHDILFLFLWCSGGLSVVGSRLQRL